MPAMRELLTGSCSSLCHQHLTSGAFRTAEGKRPQHPQTFVHDTALVLPHTEPRPRRQGRCLFQSVPAHWVQPDPSGRSALSLTIKQMGFNFKAAFLSWLSEDSGGFVQLKSSMLFLSTPGDDGLCVS